MQSGNCSDSTLDATLLAKQASQNCGYARENDTKRAFGRRRSASKLNFSRRSICHCRHTFFGARIKVRLILPAIQAWRNAVKAKMPSPYAARQNTESQTLYALAVEEGFSKSSK
jgi:hypothetical protein